MAYTNASTGLPENPGGVAFKVHKPSGSVVTDIVPTNPEVGLWEALVPTDEEGTWHARFFATGPSKVDTVSFDVKLDPDF
jgi:uncharacterized protein YfaS (alpha-2-macroglobulin family)